MERSVKPRARGTRRRAQAEATRQEILDAAMRLFADGGYVGTSVEAIAREAGVAVQTIYNAFGSKSGVLTALFDVTVAGDDRPVPLADRIGRDIHDEPDPRRIITLLADHFAATLERMLPVNAVITSAAPVDAEIAAYWQRNGELRMWGYTQAAKELAAKRGLRSGLNVDAAAAIIWTLASPDAHRSLVGQEGWSSQRYRDWIEDALAAALLA